MTYQQLTQEERYQIKAYKESGLSQSQIAMQLSRSASTISRELKRNTGLRGYRPKQAQETSELRRYTAIKHVKLTAEIQSTLVSYLKEQWSPEQIQGYCKTHDIAMVSHERIYQYIWSNKRQGGKLHENLRCQRKRYKKRYGKYDGRGVIVDRVSIDERPAIVDKKTRFGDWEGDTIIGKGHQGAMVTLVERKSKLTLMKEVPFKSAYCVTAAVIELLKPYKRNVLSITFDNGKEFARHKEIAKQLKTSIYFAHPYHSWERGLNENTNGLIRQYFPKSAPLKNACHNKVIDVNHRLNNRPRKSLGFKTPLEIFRMAA
jgi:IS30 family transposase